MIIKLQVFDSDTPNCMKAGRGFESLVLNLGALVGEEGKNTHAAQVRTLCDITHNSPSCISKSKRSPVNSKCLYLGTQGSQRFLNDHFSMDCDHWMYN
jgi:hypothetical protein